MDKFEADCLPAGPADGQVRSVVRRFGLVSAAGELAVAYDVLPWARGEATRAAKACFQSWLEERGGTDAAEDREAIEQVRAFIEQHGESRFALLGGPEGEVENPHSRTVSRVGFRRLTDTPDGCQWEYLILLKCGGKRSARALTQTAPPRFSLRLGIFCRETGKT